MSLIQSPSAVAAAEILSLIQRHQGNAESSAGLLNQITDTILALDNNSLANFGNNLGPQEMGNLTAMHGAQGEGVNQIIAGCSAIMASVGLPISSFTVDVRSLSEKLADQGREIIFDGTQFSVIDIGE